MQIIHYKAKTTILKKGKRLKEMIIVIEGLLVYVSVFFKF